MTAGDPNAHVAQAIGHVQGGRLAEAEAAWADVLERFVDDRGRIDFTGLEKDPASLDRYVASLDREDPRSHPEAFPTRDDALAFYLNAYNALAMYGVLRSGTPPELGSIRPANASVSSSLPLPAGPMMAT